MSWDEMRWEREAAEKRNEDGDAQNRVWVEVQKTHMKTHAKWNAETERQRMRSEAAEEMNPYCTYSTGQKFGVIKIFECFWKKSLTLTKAYVQTNSIYLKSFLILLIVTFDQF